MAKTAFRQRSDIASLLLAKYQRNRLQWLSDTALNQSFEAIELPLGVPTTAEAATDLKRLESWIRQWRTIEAEGFEIIWHDARWPSLGTRKTVPQRLRLSSIEEILRFVDPRMVLLKEFNRALSRAHMINKVASEIFLDVLKNKSLFFDYCDDDFERFVSLFQWLSDHRPACLFIRELPVEGVDTKWFEKHRGLLDKLLHARFKDLDWEDKSLEELWELKSPEPLVRVRGLEQFIAAIGNPSYLSLPSSVLNSIEPQSVVIFENLQTALSAKLFPGTLILMGMGMATEVLDSIIWMKRIPIYYFGDLDAHGLAILGRVRSHFPQVQSILMNEQTFRSWGHLSIQDPNLNAPEPICLTKTEQKLFEILREKRLRLEQERIPIAEVNGELEKLLKA